MQGKITFLFTSIRLFMKCAALSMHTDKYFSNKWSEEVHFKYMRNNSLWDYEVRLFNINQNLILSMLTNAELNCEVIEKINNNKKKPRSAYSEAMLT